MATTIKNENMVTLQISGEAFGYSDLNKQQIESLILNAIKCDITFTGCNGEKFSMEMMMDIQADNFTVTDEDGYELSSADEINL